MNTLKLGLGLVAFIAVGVLGGCSSPQAPDVSDNIHKTLDQQPNLKDVSVKDDRQNGVVTLGGTVANDSDKAQAETIAKQMAGGQIVSNQIAVRPPNDSTAKTVESDTDGGIKKNLDAALAQNHLKDVVKYDVDKGVVTLKGDVNSAAQRSQAEKIAASVPNVTQVVNELQLKHTKATTTKPAGL